MGAIVDPAEGEFLRSAERIDALRSQLDADISWRQRVPIWRNLVKERLALARRVVRARWRERGIPW